MKGKTGMKKLDLDLNEFQEFIKLKKIICYGSGMAGSRAISILENWNKAQDIVAFSDSNKNKWYNKIENENYSFLIVPIEEILDKINENIVILITCVTDIEEIRGMLNQYRELKNINCFSLVEIAQQQLIHSDYEILHEFNEMIIPKKIHYCWLGGEKPEFVKNMIASWKIMCPDYEIIEWNETNYDFNKNKYMKQAYETQIWGFVPDYARIDIVYTHGGIYIDTDVEILHRPDDLLYQKNFFISDCTFLVNLGSGFGAKPGDPVLGEFMEYYNDIPFKLESGELNKTGCIIHQYNVLKKYGMVINDQFQIVHGANIYPMIMGGTCVYTMQLRRNKKAFFAHYGTASWMKEGIIEKRKRLQKFFYNNCLINYSIEKI